MSTTSKKFPVVMGGGIGILAWVFGYVFTYVIVAPDIRRSVLQRLVEVFEGQSVTYEMVGWVFYNAHFVDTVFRDVPFLGGSTTSFIGGDTGFTVLLYLVPIGLLIMSGVFMAWYHGVTSNARAAGIGATVLPGYLLLSIVGVFFTEVTVGEISGGPDHLPAIIIAGVAYPVVFAIMGSVLFRWIAN